jgi:putative membrane protein
VRRGGYNRSRRRLASATPFLAARGFNDRKIFRSRRQRTHLSRLGTYRHRRHCVWFVVEKFNLFVRTIVEANALGNSKNLRLASLSGAFSHYDGLVLILLGIVIIITSLMRFIRTSRWIDDQQSHSVRGIRAELVVSVVLALIVMTMTAYFIVY